MGSRFDLGSLGLPVQPLPGVLPRAKHWGVLACGPRVHMRVPPQILWSLGSQGLCHPWAPCGFKNLTGWELGVLEPHRLHPPHATLSYPGSGEGPLLRRFSRSSPTPSLSGLGASLLCWAFVSHPINQSIGRLWSFALLSVLMGALGNSRFGGCTLHPQHCLGWDHRGPAGDGTSPPSSWGGVSLGGRSEQPDGFKQQC